MATKKKTAPTESPALKKMLDEVHKEDRYGGFIHRYAEYMSMENMGHDPSETHWSEFFMEAEAAECMDDEKRAWMRVAKPILAELKKKGLPLTIRNAESVYQSNPKKWGKPYGGK